jgi:hypothetical protein
VLHIDFFTALGMPLQKLKLLGNEASRQRALQSEVIARGFNFKRDHFEKSLKIHGPYTQGFYERELERFHGK